MPYTHKTLYPKGNENEIWDKCAGEFGINFSDFARKAINSYLEILKIFNPDTVSTPDTSFIDKELLRKVNELVKENEELRREIRNLTTDYWDKVWNAISTVRYKTVREILTDAGIINSSMDYIQIQAEINYLKEVLRDFKYQCELEGREYPLEYEPERGWRKKKP